MNTQNERKEKNEMKHRKGFISLLLVAVMLFTMPMVVLATSDDVVFYKSPALAYTIYNAESRAKDNATPVYVWAYNTPSNGFIWVQAQRQRADGTWVGDNELTTYAKALKGVKYSLHTLIYEHGGRRARLRYYGTVQGLIEGVYSADSVGTYTDLW